MSVASKSFRKTISSKLSGKLNSFISLYSTLINVVPSELFAIYGDSSLPHKTLVAEELCL